MTEDKFTKSERSTINRKKLSPQELLTMAVRLGCIFILFIDLMFESVLYERRR